MNKLKLEIESLAVVSFETAAADENRGTVRGFDSEVPYTSEITAATRCFYCPPQLPGTQAGATQDGLPGDEAILFPAPETI